MHLHLVITGHVQGVFYRGAMQDEARRHGVRGWVRNRVDGSVEAVLEGDAVAVRAVAAWARSGPPGARVRDVVERQEPEGDELVGFEIRH
jgi:acylphosphatase